MAYAVIITTVGQAKIAAAILPMGSPIVLEELAVGDDDTLHLVGAVALNNEVHRVTVNVVEAGVDYIDVEAIIPADVGGWTIREFGIVDDAGDLIVVGQYPPTYKPLPAEGSARTSVIRCRINVDPPDAFEVTVDMSVVLVTQDEHDAHVADFDAHVADFDAHVVEYDAHIVDYDAHIANTSNPHSVTAAQVIPGGDAADVPARGTGGDNDIDWHRHAGAVPKTFGYDQNTEFSTDVLASGELGILTDSNRLSDVGTADADLDVLATNADPTVVRVFDDSILVGQVKGGDGRLLTKRARFSPTVEATWTDASMTSVTDIARYGDRIYVLGATAGGSMLVCLDEDLVAVGGFTPLSMAWVSNAITVLDGDIYIATDAHGANVVMAVYDNTGTLVGTAASTGAGVNGIAIDCSGTHVWLLLDTTGEDNLEVYQGTAKLAGYDTGFATGSRLWAQGPNVLVAYKPSWIAAVGYPPSGSGSTWAPVWDVLAPGTGTALFGCGRWAYALNDIALALYDRRSGAMMAWVSLASVAAAHVAEYDGHVLWLCDQTADEVVPVQGFRVPQIWKRAAMTGLAADHQWPFWQKRYQPLGT